MSSFLSFMKMFEIYFHTILKDLNHCLKIAINQFEYKRYLELMSRYQECYYLSREYNKVFGFQVTAMSSCVAILSSFQVKQNKPQ